MRHRERPERGAPQSQFTWPNLKLVAKDLGTLEAGKAANILILDANPLQDIRNTRKIAKVISRGRVLDGQYHPDFKNPVPVDEKEASSHYFPTPRIQRALFDGSAEGKPAVGITIRGSGSFPIRW